MTIQLANPANNGSPSSARESGVASCVSQLMKAVALYLANGEAVANTALFSAKKILSIQPAIQSENDLISKESSNK